MVFLRTASKRVQVLDVYTPRPPWTTMAGLHGLSHPRSATRAVPIQISAATRAYNSRTGSRDSAQRTASKPNSDGLDPDKIKGPGGLTMTQIGRLVRESHAKDVDHRAKVQQQQQQQQEQKQQQQQPRQGPKH